MAQVITKIQEGTEAGELTCHHELHQGPDFTLGAVRGDARVVASITPAHLVKVQGPTIVADVSR